MRDRITIQTVKFLVLPMLLAAGAGCSTPPKVPSEPNEPGVHVALQAAIERADKVKEETKSAQHTADLSQQTMTVIWEGEGAEILSRIAAAQNLRFKIVGPQPRLQLPVFVKMRNVTLAQALEGIGEQFGQRADVELDDTSITLRMKLY